MHITEAIYSNGVLTPVNGLRLREKERVRLYIESIDLPTPAERAAAFARLRDGIEKMNFRHGGPYPTRDELHERR